MVEPGREMVFVFGLINCRINTFTVVAVDQDGNRSSGITAGALPWEELTGLQVTQGVGSVTLRWDPPVSPEIDQIRISYVPDGSEPTVVPATTTSIEFDKLASDVEYTFSVATFSTTLRRGGQPSIVSVKP